MKKLTIVETPFNLLENKKILFSTCETIIDINWKMKISPDDLSIYVSVPNSVFVKRVILNLLLWRVWNRKHLHLGNYIFGEFTSSTSGTRNSRSSNFICWIFSNISALVLDSIAPNFSLSNLVRKRGSNLTDVTGLSPE